jgi:glycosyltransferase involved in cell wall biosynthesis
MGCKIHQLPLQRSPLKKDNFKAYRMLRNIIISEGYDLVHTHTPVASAIVRLACRKLNSVKVFYTAHGFHFFKGAPIRNWLIYYPIEKWLAKYTDTIITINQEDYNRAKSKLKAKRVEYIPGVGIGIDKFNKVKIDKDLKRNELALPADAFVVLSVGELNKNKNHEVVIRAISKIDNPHIHYLICGEGQLDEYLRNLSKELGIEKRVHLLGFRKDVAEICKASDIFAFPSKREGLGLAAIEAMACGLPIITSNIHGIVDYSIDGLTGHCFNPTDVKDVSKGIIQLSLATKKDLDSISIYNLRKAKEYDFQIIVNQLRLIYTKLLEIS